MKFTVTPQRRGRLRRRQVRVALVADNGQELLGSEGYNNLDDALAMIHSIGVWLTGYETFEVPTEIDPSLRTSG